MSSSTPVADPYEFKKTSKDDYELAALPEVQSGKVMPVGKEDEEYEARLAVLGLGEQRIAASGTILVEANLRVAWNLGRPEQRAWSGSA